MLQLSSPAALACPLANLTHQRAFTTRFTTPDTSEIMNFMTKYLAFFLAFLSLLFQFAAALPVATLKDRDVYVPPVLYPHSGVVWYKGQKHNVTWSVYRLLYGMTNDLLIRGLTVAGTTPTLPNRSPIS